MKELILVYNLQDEQTVQTQLVPLFNASTVKLEPFFPNHSYQFPESTVVTYLSDDALVKLVSVLMGQGCTFSFLPHPHMAEATQGLGLESDLAQAVAAVEGATKAVGSDLLICNGRPVFNKVVIGSSLSLMTGSLSKSGIASLMEKVVSTFRQSSSIMPRHFTLTSDEKPPLQTAAVGVVAVLHAKNSILARTLSKLSYTNDGRLHVLVLAPRSVLELLRFYVSSLFARKNANRLPSFVGHIKAKAVTIDSPAPMDYSHDNVLMSARSIELEVCPNAFKLIPTRPLEEENQAGEPTEMYRVDRLPKGEAYLKEIVAKPLPFISHASTEEFRDLFNVLRQNAQVSKSFLTLMVRSTLLASLGLFSNSSPVIIGAMILAPLMAPIISLSMGVLRQDKKLVLNSVKTIGLGLLLSYLAAVLLTLMSPLHAMNPEIVGRIKPNLLDLGIALVSGVAGAYAHAREDVAKTLAGVAIAVALVPPLAVSGIGIGWGDWSVFTGALLLFITNLTGIVLAGIVTFMVLGFSPFHLARKGLLVSLLLVLLVSVPLWFGFSSMLRDRSIVNSLEGYHVGDITIKDVAVLQGTKPVVLSVRLLAEEPVSSQDLDYIKEVVQAKLHQEVELEVIISLRR